MKFTKTLLASAIVFTIAHANANDFTVNAVIKNETAMFSKSGSTIGNRGTQSIVGAAGATYAGVSTAATPSNSSGDLLKSETSARIFINGNVGENAALHAELRPVVDTQGVNDDYKRHDSYTQQDYLRELYIDTTVGDFNLRVGKQQVVWGTADGMKLLDIVNPTDYREMAQNSMEESRVPVWMINADKYLENGDSVQMILSQPRENVFAGLNRHIDTSVRSNYDATNSAVYGDPDQTLNNGTDTGHAFMLMGPDSITGVYNGFLNITPDLGSVAGRFTGAFKDMLTPTVDPSTAPKYSASSSTAGGAMADWRMSGFTVDGFEAMHMGSSCNGTTSVCSMTTNLAYYGMILADESDPTADTSANHFYYLPGGTGSASTDPYDDYDGFAKAVYQVADYLDDGDNTNESLDLTDATDLATVNAITGAQMLAVGFAPLYNSNLANLTDAQDSAFDYMGSATFLTFDAFGSAKSQYVYNMPTDPDLAFRYGTHLDNGLNISYAYAYAWDKNPIINLSWRNDAGEELHAVRMATSNSGVHTQSDTGASLVLTNTINDIGSFASSPTSGVVNYGSSFGRTPTLRFEQTLVRTSNFGTALDYSLDTESLGPVVLRGEFLYSKGGKQPVMDKSLLGIGDLVGALTMQDADRFKYVIGADVTVMTDMMVSAQFIQDRNLDFVDGANRYTTSYASMHLSNGFIKDIENKEFYSLFFSKPFGESGEGRWNNITMVEEGGGRWNRFDAEYSLSNDLVGTFEINKYWGDTNTQFGQLENSSNVQVGLKYIIE